MSLTQIGIGKCVDNPKALSVLGPPWAALLRLISHFLPLHRLLSGHSAAETGTELLELDCHMTADGHVVVSHDENLLRQTGRDVDVSSLDLEVRGQREAAHPGVGAGVL